MMCYGARTEGRGEGGGGKSPPPPDLLTQARNLDTDCLFQFELIRINSWCFMRFDLQIGVQGHKALYFSREDHKRSGLGSLVVHVFKTK